MPLPAAKTLGEIRTEVLDRLGLPSDGNLSANGHKQVDSFIRSACHIVAAELSMRSERKTTTRELIEDQAAYDWPEDAERILSIVVIDDEDRRFALKPGARANERATAIEAEDPGRPVLFEVLDGELFLRPAPAAEYVSLEIEYESALTEPVDSNDEIPVDAELVTALTVIKYRRNVGLPVAREDIAEFERLMNRVRARNGDGMVMHIGGPKSRRWTDPPVNRVDAGSGPTGSNSTYAEDWSPW